VIGRLDQELGLSEGLGMSIKELVRDMDGTLLDTTAVGACRVGSGGA
jgi:hypothetical protein